MASFDSSMPPSTDCSAATSCGGCRSYSGAVACGLLYSSATATDRPPSPHARRPHASPEGSSGREAGIADPNVRSSTCYRRAPTIRARRQLAEDVRNAEGPESNTGVHASLHNLWTSRWTQASRHVETAGDDPGDIRPFPLRHLRISHPPVVDGRKSTRKFEPYLTCRTSRRVAPPGTPAHAEPDRSGLAGVGPRLRGAPAGGFGARKPE